MLTLIEPLTSTITHNPYQTIIITGYDDEGIDTSSFIVEIDGLQYQAQFEESVFVFIPEEAWEEGEVEITFYCNDILGNSSPRYSSNFTVDLTPPTLEQIRPYPGSVETLSSISLAFLDTISGVDSSSIVIILNEQTFYITSSGFSWRNNSLSIDLALAGIELHQGDELSLCVTNLCDNEPDYGVPNCIEQPICITYTINVGRCRLYPIPFTPNGDGFNDYAFFEFPGFALSSGNEIEIMTSDGQMIKRLTRRQVYQGSHLWMWDGRSDKGNDMPPGVYIYKIISKGKVKCSGLISLMR